MQLKLLTILITLVLATVACQPAATTGTPVGVLVDTPSPLPGPTQTPLPERSPAPESTPTFTTNAPTRPDEAILIQEPGPGSQVTSPIRVVGFTDPTFEQNLVVRALAVDGTELAQVSTTIESEAGQRGQFEVEIPIALNEEQNIFIQVYSTSPRDGAITHLSSTGVLFSPDGSENITVQEPRPEKVALFQPQNGAAISDGIAHVAGFALASFEQTLVVEIQDAEGSVIGSQPVIVQAPDVGLPGPFSVDVVYTVNESVPGRVVVRDPSPAFGGDAHLNSVEVNLEP